MIQRMFVTLDTKKTNYKNVGKINHGDDLILELTVLSDGNMISFNDPMVDLLVKKSDGKMIRQNSGIEHIKPNKFIIEVSKDCVTSPGLSTNQLIINDNGRISTCMFYYTILNSLEEDIIESISNVEVLEQLDEFTIQMKDKMENFDEELQNRMSELEDAIDDLVEFFGDTSVDLLEAELSRNEAEQSRAQAESVRVQNESRRLQNDLDLANAEAERVRAENIRIQNEADRALVDAVMDQKESKREDSELERIQNESKRSTDELVRQQNESVRQSNESIRMSNENDRKTQENRRATAETNRVNAETTRRNNENSRISNETERQKTMNEMKSLIGNVNDFDERVGVIEDEIEEINSSLDNKVNKDDFELTKIKVDILNTKEINIRDFGAKGDGINDDTLAFKNAINSLGGTWSNITNTLFIPSGVYRITEPIQINRGYITINGAGQDQSIIYVDNDINCFEIDGSSKSSGYLYSLKIGGLTISGNNKCKKGMYINGIGLHSHLYNIVIENCKEYGLHITGYSFDFPIDNLHVRGTGKEGIFVDEQKDPFKEISYISFNKCTSVGCGKDNKDIPQWTISGSDALMLNDCKANEGLIGFNFVNNVRGIYINNVYMDGALGATSDGYKAHIFRINDSEGYNFNISNVYGWHIDTVALFLTGGKANIRNVDVIWGDGVRNNSIVVGSDYKGSITVDWTCTENFNIIDPNNKIIYPMLSTKSRIQTKNENNGYIDLGDGVILMWGTGTTKSSEYIHFPYNVSEVYHVEFSSNDDNNLGESTKTEFYVMTAFGSGVYVRCNQEGRKYTYKVIAKK